MQVKVFKRRWVERLPIQVFFFVTGSACHCAPVTSSVNCVELGRFLQFTDPLDPLCCGKQNIKDRSGARELSMLTDQQKLLATERSICSST